MEAGNRGASEVSGGRSVGLGISLPFEEDVNEYVPDELAFEFHYFFMRKFWFTYPAKAVVLFPGGFGTFFYGRIPVWAANASQIGGLEILFLRNFTSFFKAMES